MIVESKRIGVERELMLADDSRADASAMLAELPGWVMSAQRLWGLRRDLGTGAFLAARSDLEYWCPGWPLRKLFLPLRRPTTSCSSWRSSSSWLHLGGANACPRSFEPCSSCLDRLRDPSVSFQGSCPMYLLYHPDSAHYYLFLSNKEHHREKLSSQCAYSGLRPNKKAPPHSKAIF